MISNAWLLICGLLKVLLMWLEINKEQRADIKEKKQEVVDLTKQAFTGDIKDAKSKIASAIDKLGDIK